MRKILLLLWMLISLNGVAQTTTITVSGTVADTNSIPYSTYSIVLVNNGQEQVSTVNGSTFTQTFSGSLNASGAFSGVVLTDNQAISPGGSAWQFTFCTVSSYRCFNQTITVSYSTGPCLGTTSCSLTSTFVVPVANPAPSAQPVLILGGTVGLSDGFTPNTIGFSAISASTGQNKPLAIFVGPTGNGTMVDNAGVLRTITGLGYTQTIASGTFVLGTSQINSGACASVVTVASAGVLSTDIIQAGFNSDPTAVTGYGNSGSGAVLTIYPYPTAGNANVKVCNNTAGNITPSALTLNFRVTR